MFGLLICPTVPVRLTGYSQYFNLPPLHDLLVISEWFTNHGGKLCEEIELSCEETECLHFLTNDM